MSRLRSPELQLSGSFRVCRPILQRRLVGVTILPRDAVQARYVRSAMLLQLPVPLAALSRVKTTENIL